MQSLEAASEQISSLDPGHHPLTQLKTNVLMSSCLLFLRRHKATIQSPDLACQHNKLTEVKSLQSCWHVWLWLCNLQRSLFGTCKPSSKIQDVPNRETRDFDFQPTSHKVAKRLNSPHNEVQKMMTFLLFFDNAIYVISFQIWLDLRNEECWQRPAIEFSEQRRWSIVSLIQLHSEKKVLSPVWTRTSREGCKSSFYCY